MVFLINRNTTTNLLFSGGIIASVYVLNKSSIHAAVLVRFKAILEAIIKCAYSMTTETKQV